MNESSHAAKLDEVESVLRPLLKREGFRCTNRNCRRESEPGLIQILNFQLGQSGSSLSDSFTLNLRIYLEEVHELLHAGNHPPKSISEPNCEFRARLLTLLPSGTDRWLKLDASPECVAQEVSEALTSIGFPILRRYLTRNSILSEWRQRDGAAIRWIGRAEAAVGILLARRGETQEATNVFQRWFDGGNPVARPFVNRVARNLGLELIGA